MEKVKVKKIEYVLIHIAMALLLIVAVEVRSEKENESELEATSQPALAKAAVNNAITTTIETAITETVKVDKVAVTEPSTETDSVELYDVPLDAELQYYIMDLCEDANISTALVMAIIERESKFDPLEVGDNGNSLGLMQIQPKWHQWRMDKLGGGDWFDPYDNVAVGVNILADLFHKYGDDIYMVLMAYNGGCSYAEGMIEKGTYSDYAIEVDARAEALEHIEEK